MQHYLLVPVTWVVAWDCAVFSNYAFYYVFNDFEGVIASFDQNISSKSTYI